MKTSFFCQITSSHLGVGEGCFNELQYRQQLKGHLASSPHILAHNRVSIRAVPSKRAVPSLEENPQIPVDWCLKTFL